MLARLRAYIAAIFSEERGRCRVILGIIIGVALFARLYRLSDSPPGLNGDELFNAMDALRIGREWPIYFEGNFGREALFFYLLAPSLRLLGETVFALRLPAALLGTGSVWLAYIVGRNGFNRRVGLLAAGLMALSLWPLMESRWALRAVSLTFCSALTVALMQSAARRGRWRDWLLAGIALGLTMYTYIPSRIFPAVILGWLIWLFVSRWKSVRPQWPKMALSWLVGFIIFAPYGVYMLRYPYRIDHRINTINVALDTALQQGNWRPLGQSILGVLKMFTILGDQDWRYHVSGQPVFDPVTGFFFYVGAALCLWFAFYFWERISRGARPCTPTGHLVEKGRSRPQGLLRPVGFDNQASYALLLLWAGVMLVPNAILEANSGFLRAAGAIVPLYLMAAIGFDTLASLLAQRLPILAKWRVFAGLAAIGLGVIFLRSWHDYFVIWNNNSEVRRIYQADLATIGRYLNDNPPPEGIRVFIARDYAHDLAPRTFAYYSDAPVSWFDPDRTLVWTQDTPEWVIVPAGTELSAELMAHLDVEAATTTIRYGDGQPAFSIYEMPSLEALPQHDMAVTYVDAPRLIGYDVMAQEGAAETIYRGDTLALVLYWEIPPGLPPLPNQLTNAMIELEDSQGNVWARNGDLMGYPQANWEEGDRFAQLLALDIPSGMVPGPAYFRFDVLYSDGTRYAIQEGDNRDGPVIVRSRPFTDFTPSPDMLVFDNTLVLRESTLSTLIAPGLLVDIALDWVALDVPSMDYQVQLQLARPGETEPFLTQTFGIWPDTYPTSEWQAGEQVMSFHRLSIPLDVPTDTNPELRAVLLSPEGDPLPITQGDNTLVELTWSLREHLFEAPTIEHPLEAQFGESIRFLGYALDTSQAHPGGELALTLYWQAIDTPAQTWIIFDHLVGEDNLLCGQFDGPPSGEAWLMETWLPGEVVVDERRIPVRGEAAGERCWLIIGLYDAETSDRLPVSVNGERQPSDQLILTEVAVE
jgi:4-amino-4-deoxy-L-arabinose transferase-like glycosyltransferase